MSDFKLLNALLLALVTLIGVAAIAFLIWMALLPTQFTPPR